MNWNNKNLYNSPYPKLIMSEKEASSQNPKFVVWFSELNRDSGPTAGGKGANLGEMTKSGFPVPPGFVVTAQAYEYFINNSKLHDKLKKIVEETDVQNTKQLNENTKKIRELILNSEMPKEMEEDIIEAYEALDINKEAMKNAEGTALDILKRSHEPTFVAVRSSATTEDLETASFAGQQDTYLNVKGNSELIEHVKKCFSSLFTARATYYRKTKGFKFDESKLAVVVQKMIDADKSGVIFSKNPTSGKDDIMLEAVFGLGEGIVSGMINPDHYIVSRDLEIKESQISDKKIALTRDSSGKKTTVELTPELSNAQVLKNHEIKKLTEYAIKLDDHYKKAQDIEFAIEKGEIYILQTRAITTISEKGKTGGEIPEPKGEVLLQGQAASPGIASGVVKIIKEKGDLEKIKKGDILVTKMTDPDMVVSMAKSAAIVTDDGGMTSHAAIVSREMGIPAIVGTRKATNELSDGFLITVDGFHGKVFKGKVSENVQKEVLPVVDTKTKIKVIVDLPSSAERASKSKAKAVGLTRIEGIIAEAQKHPAFFLKNKNLAGYEEIIYKGIDGIAKYFDEVWIRTSDLRSDEFSRLEGAPEIEGNPMLGMHGIRYSLKYPEILEAELRALKKVAEKGKTMGILMPQLVLVDELKKVKEYVEKLDFKDLRVGIMIETPASVQIIEELCKEGISFISFGTNDLTQYTMAIDRNNPEVQYLHDESNPAVLKQMAHVIEVCKKYNVETSICGAAGAKKEIAKFLVEKGIDSISVAADAASEISKYVAELEKSIPQETTIKEETQNEVIEKTPDSNVIQTDKQQASGIQNSDTKMIEKENPQQLEIENEEVDNTQKDSASTNVNSDSQRVGDFTGGKSLSGNERAESNKQSPTQEIATTENEEENIDYEERFLKEESNDKNVSPNESKNQEENNEQNIFQDKGAFITLFGDDNIEKNVEEESKDEEPNPETKDDNDDKEDWQEKVIEKTQKNEYDNGIQDDSNGMGGQNKNPVNEVRENKKDEDETLDIF
jgi:pyruvate, water dikinase